MAGGSPGDRSLEQTSTWAVALVCAVFVAISITIELAIQSLGKWFEKREKKAMIEALEKIKSELMLLGFISLLLSVGTTYVASICVPEKFGNKWLPCDEAIPVIKEDDKLGTSFTRARLLASSATDKIDVCSKKGKVSLISYSGIHQLHIFIFVLAVIHILYSVILMALGHAKMKKWKAWELETSTFEYEFSNDPTRFRFAHQTSFVRRHAGVYSSPGIKWIVAFFRQFFGSISKVDYMTIRNGFINAHFAPNTKFDFHKYIKRSMEDDYKSVLGISIPLWFFAILFLFFNIYKWHTLVWTSLIPFFIILMVGMKMEVVIMEMAQQIQEKSTVVRGAPLVVPTNNFFWFNSPQWILFLIHFTLFQNAYQMAYFLWKWYEFGITTCFHEKLYAILARVGLGVAFQILCSYITFPLYALVTQMGSHMKKSIFEDQTTKAIKKWHQAAKKKKKAQGDGMSTAEASTPSRNSSPIHLLHKYQLNAGKENENIPDSPRSYVSDIDLPELEPSKPEYHSIDFSFVQSRG